MQLAARLEHKLLIDIFSLGQIKLIDFGFILLQARQHPLRIRQQIALERELDQRQKPLLDRKTFTLPISVPRRVNIFVDVVIGAGGNQLRTLIGFERPVVFAPTVPPTDKFRDKILVLDEKIDAPLSAVDDADGILDEERKTRAAFGLERGEFVDEVGAEIYSIDPRGEIVGVLLEREQSRLDDGGSEIELLCKEILSLGEQFIFGGVEIGIVDIPRV